MRWPTLEDDLRELERMDPEVGEAARKLDATIASILARPREFDAKELFAIAEDS